jgi:hypothetical protein
MTAMAQAREQRLTCCERCGRTFVLSYARNGLGNTLANSVMTTAWVHCPWGDCNRFQPVLVPLEGSGASVEVWLGQPRAAARLPTLRDALGWSKRRA